MEALILAGGYGTRLRPLTLSKPKSLINFCNKSILEHQVEALCKIKVTKIILAISYLPSVMLEAVNELREKYKVNIVCSVEDEPLGTGGSIRLAEKLLMGDKSNKSLDENFYVCNSDIICDFPFEDLLSFHEQKKAEATILVTAVDDASKFGVVLSDSEGKVCCFVEKPANHIGNRINSGIYIFKKSIIKKIPLANTSLERVIFPQLVKDGKLYCMEHEGFWSDIGQPHHFLEATKMYMNSLVNKRALCQNDGDVTDEMRSLIVGDNISGNVLVGSGTLIGDGCLIGPNVSIAAKCTIGKGCRLRNCTIMEGVRVGDFSLIGDSIVGWESRIGKWVRIDGVTVVGENVKVPDEVYVNAAFILPHKEINESLNQPGAIVL